MSNLTDGAPKSVLHDSSFSGGNDTMVTSQGNVDVLNNEFTSNFASNGTVVLTSSGENQRLFSGNVFTDIQYSLVASDENALITSNRFVDGGMGIEYHYGTIIDNVFTSNGLGIRVENGTDHSIRNNRFFANVTSIRIYDDAPVEIRNNTFIQYPDNGFNQYQTQAIWVDNNDEVTLVRDNIFVLQGTNEFAGARAFLVESQGQEGFDADWNLFSLGDHSHIGQWGDATINSLTDWQLAVSSDANSVLGDPMFQNMLGSDGLLGYDIANGDGSLDNDVRLQIGSIAIDRGDPSSRFDLEPYSNGNRTDIGWTGNSAYGSVATDPLVQILSPNAGERLGIGTQVPVDIRSAGLAEEDPVLFVNINGDKVSGSESWNSWQAGTAVATQAGTGATDNDSFTGAFAPQSVYQSFDASELQDASQILRYGLDLADGDYRIRVHFILQDDHLANGETLADISVNGVNQISGFDIGNVSGNSGHSVAIAQMDVTLSGGAGLDLLLEEMGLGTLYVAALEISRVTQPGTNPASVDLEVSYDGGLTFSAIAQNVALDRYGATSIDWTPDTVTVGAFTLLRATATNGVATVSDLSEQSMLVLGETNTYYINDASTDGDLFSTAIGSNANTGMTADSPLASLEALFAYYTLKAGDTVYIDAGSYVINQDIVLDESISGTDTDRLVFVGAGEATIIDRNSTDSGTASFEFAGADYVTLKDMTLVGGRSGAEFASGTSSTDITIENVDIADFRFAAIHVNSGTHDVSVTGGTMSLQAYSSAKYGLFNTGNSSSMSLADVTINNMGYGIYKNSASDLTLERVTMSDVNIGLYARYNNTNISDSTITARNGSNGYGVRITGDNSSIEASTISGFNGSNGRAIDVRSGAQVVGNEVFDNKRGIIANGSTVVVNANHVHDNETGIRSTSSQLTGNLIENNDYGIERASGTINAHNNILRGNAVAGFQIASSGNVSHQIVNNTIVQSSGTALLTTGNNGELNVSSNIFAIDGAASLAFDLDASAQSGFTADYNVYQLTNGAQLADWDGQSLTDLSAFNLATGHGANSLQGMAGFVDAAAGDFHLLGSSIAIDAGDPSLPVGDEPEDNGDRVNSGAYGGTAEAAIRVINTAPVAIAGTTTVAEDGSVEIQLTGTDGDGDSLTYAIVSGPDHGTISGFDVNSGQFTYSPNGDFNGSDVIRFSVSDPSGSRSEADVSITVTPVNDAPVIDALADQTLNEGDTLTLPVGVTDIDGDPVTLSLIAGPVGASLSGNEIRYSPTDNEGPVTITVSASDGTTTTDRSFTLTVNNVAPVAGSLADETVTLGEPVSLSLGFSDAGADDTHTAQINWGDGTIEAGIISNGQITGTHTYAATGDYDATVTLTDDDGASDTATASYQVASPANTAPVAIAGTATVAEDGSAQIQLTGTDGDGDSLTYAIVSGPDHGTISGFDANSGQVTYSPNGNFNGSDVIRFSVSDPSGSRSEADVSITVTPVNDAPSIDALANQTLNEGDTLTLPVGVTDIDGDPVTLSLIAGPVGASLSGNEIRYSPTDNEGPVTITVSASDGTATTDRSFTLTVNNVAPVAGSLADETVTLGDPVSLSLGFSDAGAGDTHTAQINWGDGTIEAGIISNGQITGTHTYAATGDYDVTVTIADDDGASDIVTTTMRIEQEDAGSGNGSSSETDAGTDTGSGDSNSSGGSSGSFRNLFNGLDNFFNQLVSHINRLSDRFFNDNQSGLLAPSTSGQGSSDDGPNTRYTYSSSNQNFGGVTSRGVDQISTASIPDNEEKSQAATKKTEGNSTPNRWVGTEGPDIINTSSSDDFIIAGKGNDAIDGGLGVDTVLMSGSVADYTIEQQEDGAIKVKDNRQNQPDGEDILKNVEILQFQEGKFTLDAETGELIPYEALSLVLGIASSRSALKDLKKRQAKQIIADGLDLSRYSRTDSRSSSKHKDMSALRRGRYHLDSGSDSLQRINNDPPPVWDMESQHAAE
ncbi:MAG: tandem-95 repeat protein [Cohaesibacter sp.]|nr:tandem-95 repeat protein [Cohaesibacter sp.]